MEVRELTSKARAPSKHCNMKVRLNGQDQRASSICYEARKETLSFLLMHSVVHRRMDEAIYWWVLQLQSQEAEIDSLGKVQGGQRFCLHVFSVYQFFTFLRRVLVYLFFGLILKHSFDLFFQFFLWCPF